MVTKEQAQQTADRAINLSRAFPHSTLRGAEVVKEFQGKPLDTWAVTGVPNKDGSIVYTHLLIGESTLDHFTNEDVPAVALHETAHNCFTWFHPDGMFLGDHTMGEAANVFEDGRINSYIRRNYPNVGYRFPDVYKALEKIGKPAVMPPVSDNADPALKVQEEYFERAMAMLIKENGIPGSGEVLLRDPAWVRTNDERYFLERAMDLYKLYCGSQPNATLGKSFNMACNAKAMQFLYSFDKMCGKFFNLPAKALPSKEQALYDLDRAKTLLPDLKDRLRNSPDIYDKMVEALGVSEKEISAGTITHKNYGTVLSVESMVKDRDGLVKQASQAPTIAQYAAKLNEVVSEYELDTQSKGQKLEDAVFIKEMRSAMEITDFDAMIKAAIKRFPHAESVFGLKPYDPLLSTKDGAGVIKAIKNYFDASQSLRRKWGNTNGNAKPEEGGDKEPNGEEQDGSKEGEGKEGEGKEGEGKEGKGEGKGQGKGEGKGQGKGQGQGQGKGEGKGKGQGQGEGKGSGEGSGQGQGGIGHGGGRPGKGKGPGSGNTPKFERRKIREEELPFRIPAGKDPIRDERETLSRKPKAPGQGGMNSQIEISSTRVACYEQMLRDNFLSAQMKSGAGEEVKSTSAYLGRVRGDKYVKNRLSGGVSDKEFFDTYTTLTSDTIVKGEDLSPKLVVFLMDCSGSMHHLARELGAFGVALKVLCDEKETRSLIVVGSDNNLALIDSNDPSNRAIGKLAILDAYETGFHNSNGGNCPTWSMEVLEQVRTQMEQYPASEVKLICGTDLAIPREEIEFIRDLQTRFPTVVLNDVPENIVTQLGEFIKVRKPETEYYHNEIDAQDVEVTL